MTSGRVGMSTSKRHGLFVAAVVALTAWAMAPMASAASWGVVGTTHVLDSPAFTLDTNLNGFAVAAASCAQSRLHVEVQSTAALTVTGASFNNCQASGYTAGCAVTADAANLPWIVTAPATTNVSVDNTQVNVTFTTTGSTFCVFKDSPPFIMTGRLGGGTWNQAQHEITFANQTGLTSHFPVGGPFPTVVAGTLRDTSQTLSLVDS
ncbi:MAG TPA: hypothetical protein VFY45_03000 [Baekduia sp.]|nr:hypothetical protein [Baekduia sp.]